MTKAELIRAHKAELIAKMIEMDAALVPYQADLYLYPDGEMYVFNNPGGNSWADDDHIKIWSVDNSCTTPESCGYQAGDFEEPEAWAEEYRAICENNTDYYDAIISGKIEDAEERESN